MSGRSSAMIYLNDLNVIAQIYTRDYKFNYGPMDR
jgi:hypothetical protein